MIKNPKILPKVDRLSAFFDTFELKASLEPTRANDRQARLFVIGEPGGRAEKIILCLRGDTIPEPPALVTATVDFEGVHNPLLNALPDQVLVEINDIPTLRDTTAAFLAEALESRCGRSAALNRLCEVMVLLICGQRSTAVQPDLAYWQACPTPHYTGHWSLCMMLRLALGTSKTLLRRPGCHEAILWLFFATWLAQRPRLT
ncbi:cupin domain-containing protein [Rhizobium laguerreae]|uniref:cupin domain-containing protein n=1 Tax=Rhizobium laguerreae TaxID=1076926 RepID=UPI001FE39AF7|nr:cupin domain-containing protein [Rhizobium laguerreae]